MQAQIFNVALAPARQNHSIELARQDQLLPHPVDMHQGGDADAQHGYVEDRAARRVRHVRQHPPERWFGQAPGNEQNAFWFFV